MATDARERVPARPGRRWWRSLDPVAWLVLALGAFAQQPGLTTFDTKFDLTADPVRFLSRALHLWDPTASLGQLQNQAYGYFFPQGAFFVVGKLLEVPPWVTQRLWCALLLVAAYEGARRLARAVGLSPWWAASVAGLAYAFSPRLLAEVGTVSGEIVPTCVLPWVALPIVHSLRGRLDARAAGLTSAAVLLLTGGVNATANLAVLPLPLLLVLLGPTAFRGLRRRLLLWWCGGVVLASLWWLLPLVILGRYSPPFLDYIETASVTTAPESWSNLLRGADHWLMFFSSSGRPWWPAGLELVTTPALVVVTAAVAAIGLTGLLVRSMPWRRALAAAALLGLACMYVGHAGVFSTPLDGLARTLLDGPLAPFRNVHKADPLVRLPLALGFAHAVTAGASVLRNRLGDRVRRAELRPVATRAVLTGAVLLLLASAWPMWAGQLRTPGWRSVPPAWSQAASWLHRHADGRRTLVVPGAGFGIQTWGTTIDEPLQGLARSPWVTRGQVPLAPGQTVRFLDAVEQRLVGGAGDPALADVLARSGIGFVLARGDLEPDQTDAPSVQRVESTLAQSPGIRLADSFGHGPAFGGALLNVYQVERAVPRATAVDARAVARLAGAPDAVVPAVSGGVVGARQPVVLTGARHRPPQVVADTYRRVEREFGRVHDAVSGPMTPHDSFRLRRPVRDYPGVPGERPVWLAPRTFLRATASSSRGFADTLGPVLPSQSPWAAVDGDPATAWTSAPFTDPARQWLAFTLRRPSPVTTLGVAFAVDPGQTAVVRKVAITAGSTTRIATVDPRSGRASADFSGTAVRRIRVAPASVTGPAGTVAVREISFPGMSTEQPLVLPDVPTTGHTAFLLTADPGRRACVATLIGPDCDAGSTRAPEAGSRLSRLLTTRVGGRYDVSGSVVARASPATASLTAPVIGGVTVVGSSVWQNDPAVSGQFAYDADPTTTWMSGPADPRPSLSLSWRGNRTLDRLRVTGGTAGGSLPGTAVLTSGAQTRTVDLRAGFGFFAPVRTHRLRISFLREPGASTGPLSIGELHFAGLDALRYRVPLATRTGAPCGLGPEVVVDGRTHPTRVSGTLQDVVTGAALSLHSCDGPLRLGPGRHDVEIRSTSQFAPATVVLAPTAATATRVTQRFLTVARWHETSRVLSIGAGRRALLRIPENTNPGWRATFHGRPLASVPVDGWQQGWWVPAGAGGRVVLTYTPQTGYQWSLVAGAAATLLLVVLAGWSLLRRSPVARSAAPDRVAGRVDAHLGRRTVWPLWGVAAVLSWSFGGPAVLIGVAAGLVLRLGGYGREVPYVGGLMVAISGVVALLAGSMSRGSPGLAADLVAGIGLGLLLTILVKGDEGGLASR